MKLRFNMKHPKYVAVAAVACLMFTTLPSYAYDEQAKMKAAMFALQTKFDDKFADSLSLSEYGVCVHSGIKYGLMWVKQKNMDETIQITFQLIDYGLQKFRKRTLAANVMTGEQILKTSITQGKYIYDRNPQQADNMCVEKASIIINS